MRYPRREEEGPRLLARIHCPHGHAFLIYDKCPETQDPPAPEPSRRELRKMKRDLKRFLREQ